MIRLPSKEKTIQRLSLKGLKKSAKKIEKGVDKRDLWWYYSQAVRRGSDTDGR
ncbi:hypothetical protein SUBVAR_04779 [Subdoligranulum variabile DSM 15176]|uniref:Uncharacterized protein n=1 Tax=Subdoligranulum variabile DSM 15176 TaxID=411471 RepID=D1PK60_9FIRM|nr:hypothetical protein SUBVAR_04779 [Subdoligranulum variabile DSM 15176]